MILEMIIRRLRARVVLFENHVAGSVDTQGWMEHRSQFAPFAFVIPTGVTVADDQGGLKRAGQLMLQHSYQVQVIMCTLDDDRNQIAAQDIDEIRRRVVLALHGWKPSEHLQAMRFLRMDVGQQTAEYSLWLFTFAMQERFEPCAPECGLSDEDLAYLEKEGVTCDQLIMQDLMAQGSGPIGDMAKSIPGFVHVPECDGVCGDAVGAPLVDCNQEDCANGQ